MTSRGLVERFSHARRSWVAFFRVSDERVAELWVLGGHDGLRARLAAASR
ncbi:MAG: hypothetical protein AAGI70_01050 [Pseudomonadota bacterium]